MNVELVVTEYNLTLIPQLPAGSGQMPADSGQMTVDSAELATILHDPVIGGEPLRAVSARDQLSLVFSPPTATVIDHNGAPPVRPEMAVAAIGVIEMFHARGFSTQAYGWNVQGDLIGPEAGNTMDQLADTRRLTDLLGNRGEVWTVPRLTLSVNTELTGVDHIDVTLQVSAEPDGLEGLRFDANARCEQLPDIDHLGDEGARVWAAISEVIQRLLS